MQFRTSFQFPKSSKPIDYHSKIVSLGSCFSEHIAEKLEFQKFRVTANPFGIIFHPLAIEKLLERVIKNHLFNENDFFIHNDMWHCFDFHSELSQSNPQELQTKANEQLKLLRYSISESTHIFITLGTSWVYFLKNTKQSVANCHKMPQQQFEKKLLNPKIIEKSLTLIAKYIQQLNAETQIIFTISPVRHLKDGLIENQRSKSHLITALHSLLGKK